MKRLLICLALLLTSTWIQAEPN
ncbi:MAG TPA: cytochrome C, partial [Methylophaga sp.]|nr:cytochrome C [Methylophaga sp.]